MKAFRNIGLLVGLVWAGAAQGAVITSTPFSMGYGANHNVGTQAGQWSDDETSASNTNVSSPFGLSVVFSSRTPSADGDDSYDGGSSGSGPVFTNTDPNAPRVLHDSPGGPGTGFSSWSPRFQVTVTGSYLGPTPLDAAPNPNYQFSLVITSISIWGSAQGYGGSGSNNDMNFTETTPSHGDSSPSQALPSGLSFSLHEAVGYNQLAWNPTNFTTTGITDARTFVLNTDQAPHQRSIDGFEVFGYLELTYTTPEPASFGLLATGGLLLLRRRR